MLVVPAICTISSCQARGMSQLPPDCVGRVIETPKYVSVKGAAPNFNSINGGTPSFKILPVLHIQDKGGQNTINVFQPFAWKYDSNQIRAFGMLFNALNTLLSETSTLQAFNYCTSHLPFIKITCVVFSNLHNSCI